jgi:hypothetical protein
VLYCWARAGSADDVGARYTFNRSHQRLCPPLSLAATDAGGQLRHELVSGTVHVAAVQRWLRGPPATVQRGVGARRESCSCVPIFFFVRIEVPGACKQPALARQLRCRSRVHHFSQLFSGRLHLTLFIFFTLIYERSNPLPLAFLSLHPACSSTCIIALGCFVLASPCVFAPMVKQNLAASKCLAS